MIFMSSFFVADSILGLVDSCASAIQLNFVISLDAWTCFVFGATASRLQVVADVLFHGIAGAMGVSNFRVVF